MAAVIGALRADLSASVAQFESDMGKAAKAVEAFGNRAQKVSRSLQDAGAQMTLAITAPIAALGTLFGRAAIDAEEMQSAFNVSFGSMAQATREWAETTGDALGRSTFELQEAALAFNGLFKAGGPATEQMAELAKQFTVLAQDLSSFHNVTPEDALERLRSGLSGEAEPLRKFNVYLTEATVQQRALSMGLAKTTKEISEQDKILARAALIMEATTEAQGDVLRTQDSAQNKIREANANWQELSVTLGTRLIPIIGDVANVLGDLVEKFGQISPAMQDFILIGAGVAATLGPLIWAAGSLAGAVANLAPIWAGIAKWFTDAMVATGITNVSVALRGLAAYLAPFAAAIGVVVASLWTFRGTLEEAFGYLVTHFQQTVLPAIENLWSALQELFGAFGEAMEGALGKFVDFVMWVVAEVSALFLQGLGHAVLMTVSTVVDLLATAVRAVADLVKVVSALLRGDWAGAWESAGDLVSNILGGILEAFENILPGITGAVMAVVDAIREGWQNQIGAILTWVENRFPGLVDAVASAARGAVAWAQNLYNGIKTWIQDNLGPLLRWAQERIRELNSLFGWIQRRQAQVRGGGGDDAPKPSDAPAPPPRDDPAPPPAAAGGGGAGGGGRSGSSRAANQLKKETEKFKEALEDVQTSIDQAFSRSNLPRSIQQANDLRQQLAELAEEAKEGGVDVGAFAAQMATLQTRIEELEIEGVALEAQAFARDVRDLADEVQGFAGDLPALDVQLRTIDRDYEDLRQEILDQIRENAALADANDAAAEAMRRLQEQLGRLDTAHRKAKESAQALHDAEQRLADLQAASDRAGTEQQITDLQRRRGEDQTFSRGMQEVRQIEEELAAMRMDSALELAALNRDMVEAQASGDEAQVLRLQQQIALQEQLHQLVSTTTATQIQAAERLQRAFEGFVDGLSDELTDMVMEWEFDLDGLRSVFKDLARDLFIKPVTDSFSAGIGSFLKGFAGGFAKGGSFGPGQWAITSEDGPELVYSGAKRMNVISNEEAFGRRGGTTVNQYISTPNADSFRASQRQVARRAKQTLGADS